MKRLALLLLLLLPLVASAEDHFINDAYRASKDAFKVGCEWISFPDYEDRAAWEKLMTSSQRKSYVSKGEKLLKYRWQTIPASTFLALYTTGDKQEMRRIERANREALINLTLAELAEGKGRFLPQIADGLWFYGTSYHWSHSNQTKGHLPRHDDERLGLGSIRLGVTVPVVTYLFRKQLDRIEPSIALNVEAAVKRIILDPFLNEANDSTSVHWWLGFTGRKPNNWSPWCNHGVTLAALLVEKDQSRLDAILDKTSRSVDSYFNSLTDDGCCDEGSTYWGQAIPRFCQYLQLLEDASGGKCTIRPNVKLSAISDYVSRVTACCDESGKTWAINFGDASPSIGSNPYLVWSVARFTGSRELADYALFRTFSEKKNKFALSYPVSDEGARALEFLGYYHEMKKGIGELNKRIENGEKPSDILSELRKHVPAYTYYKDVHELVARTEDNWVIGAKFGSPGVQHGHNDVGEAIVYVDNNPILIDVGVATYTADTFGPNRFKLWSMRSDYHSCAAPNSALQKNGAEYEAKPSSFVRKGSRAVFSADIAPSYPDSDVRKYLRSIEIEDASVTKLLIKDNFILSSRKASDKEYLITPCEVVKTSDNTLALKYDGTILSLRCSRNLSASVEEVEIPEPSLKRKWPRGLRRIVLESSASAPLSGEYSIEITRK